VQLPNGQTFDNGNYASNLFFLNNYYHFRAFQKWQPYVGAGLVWSQEVDIDYEENGFETSFSGDSKTGWQLFVGTDYKISSQWSLLAEIRYTSLNSLTLVSENNTDEVFSNIDYEPLSLQAGLKYQF
ncbi:MAG: OmpW family outer membrane protein, partial [Pseudomonadota bacterium]